MAKKKRGRKKKGGLFGVENSKALPVKNTIVPALATIITGVAAAGAGAALGVYSIPLGALVAWYGIRKNDEHSKYYIAAGLGLASGIPTKNALSSGTNGIEDDLEGFDLKAIGINAKDRAMDYFKSLGVKSGIMKAENSEGSTDGLNGGNDSVQYFLNPYSAKGPDLTELDRIQQQIEQMHQQEVSGTVGDLEDSQINY